MPRESENLQLRWTSGRDLNDSSPCLCGPPAADSAHGFSVIRLPRKFPLELLARGNNTEQIVIVDFLPRKFKQSPSPPPSSLIRTLGTPSGLAVLFHSPHLLHSQARQAPARFSITLRAGLFRAPSTMADDLHCVDFMHRTSFMHRPSNTTLQPNPDISGVGVSLFSPEASFCVLEIALIHSPGGHGVPRVSMVCRDDSVGAILVRCSTKPRRPPSGSEVLRRQNERLPPVEASVKGCPGILCRPADHHGAGHPHRRVQVAYPGWDGSLPLEFRYLPRLDEFHCPPPIHLHHSGGRRERYSRGPKLSCLRHGPPTLFARYCSLANS